MNLLPLTACRKTASAAISANGITARARPLRYSSGSSAMWPCATCQPAVNSAPANRKAATRPTSAVIFEASGIQSGRAYASVASATRRLRSRQTSSPA